MFMPENLRTDCASIGQRCATVVIFARRPPERLPRFHRLGVGQNGPSVRSRIHWLTLVAALSERVERRDLAWGRRRFSTGTPCRESRIQNLIISRARRLRTRPLFRADGVPVTRSLPAENLCSSAAPTAEFSRLNGGGQRAGCTWRVPTLSWIQENEARAKPRRVCDDTLMPLSLVGP